MNAIECSNIVKSFGEPPLTILKGISFTVAKGEFLSITGRSGSGKSTLLYSISGLDKINSGTVRLLGNDIHSMSEKEIHIFRNRKLGFVFQFHYLLPEISALDNILMPARKIKEEKKKFKMAIELMKSFNIYHCKDKLPSQMSGGEMQRTAMARALIMEPEILFADEPTGNLDTENGEKVMDILLKINKEMNTTVVMVTHEPDFASMASRQIHLVDGQIDYDSKGKNK
ncbi:MAG TPA: ABC transporter ATP-binding protein [Spirochaetota bacterium]|jgi:putative ABC transport system ATP-binding protein/lipoprotein-releasing system ATP-binding protein|nr:ABC transporter ATP-binding protein [Spirochaetota bacterium]OQA96840.1 MAG: Lipoprotein-releasing system ATP-binding protein LolD [Spirochaetes bacterium ADurb.Bin218]HOK01369.1 ABC transporter ATP-binding protein [Spirochaetota bacterium]HOK92516.1 ABC transporter ATP-binding protein [Spirochaetota bacterium]HON16038.1 ABC transporter ATP-binding protein [Spirochaetota bacterium]